MKTPEGHVLGQHQGLMYYTLGQRQGLGIGGQKDGNTEPWFVAAKDMATNTLIVVQGHDHPLLKRSTLAAGQLNWISGDSPRPRQALHREDPLPPDRRTLPHHPARRRHAGPRVRRPAMGGHARPVRRAV